jgi:hypothetical protein
MAYKVIRTIENADSYRLDFRSESVRSMDDNVKTAGVTLGMLCRSKSHAIMAISRQPEDAF